MDTPHSDKTQNDKISKSSMSRVPTHDHDGKVNGFLAELQKDGKFTTSYLSCVVPGSFKGYHLHRVRAANYVIVRGKIHIILYEKIGGSWQRQEHTLDSVKAETIHIPKDVATGFEAVGDEECWIVNFPDPPYDPELEDEQVEYTEEELEKGIVK